MGDDFVVQTDPCASLKKPTCVISSTFIPKHLGQLHADVNLDAAHQPDTITSHARTCDKMLCRLFDEQLHEGHYAITCLHCQLTWRKVNLLSVRTVIVENKRCQKDNMTDYQQNLQKFLIALAADLPQGESPQDGLCNSLLLTPIQILKGPDVRSCLIAPCLSSSWPVHRRSE